MNRSSALLSSEVQSRKKQIQFLKWHFLCPKVKALSTFPARELASAYYPGHKVCQQLVMYPVYSYGTVWCGQRHHVKITSMYMVGKAIKVSPFRATITVKSLAHTQGTQVIWTSENTDKKISLIKNTTRNFLYLHNDRKSWRQEIFSETVKKIPSFRPKTYLYLDELHNIFKYFRSHIKI